MFKCLRFFFTWSEWHLVRFMHNSQQAVGFLLMIRVNLWPRCHRDVQVEDSQFICMRAPRLSLMVFRNRKNLPGQCQECIQFLERKKVAILELETVAGCHCDSNRSLEVGFGNPPCGSFH